MTVKELIERLQGYDGDLVVSVMHEFEVPVQEKPQKWQFESLVADTAYSARDRKIILIGQELDDD